MKAYKVELLIIDHDQLGASAIKQVIEQTRYTNHCINPAVVCVQWADIGEWSDSHPLNRRDTWIDEFRRIFNL